MTGSLRWILYLTILGLYLLHNDLWLWDDSSLVMGLPVGLLYHIVFCLAAAVLMTLLVIYSWPSWLEIDEEDEFQ